MKCREIDYFKGILQKGFLKHVFRPLSCSPYFPWSLTKDFGGSLSNSLHLLYAPKPCRFKNHKNLGLVTP